MAKEEAKKTPASPGGGKPPKKAGKLKFMLLMIVTGMAMPFMLPTIVLLLAGLAPTYVAFATDDDSQKSGTVSVASMNFAGIVPFLIDLWSKGQTAENAFHILSDSKTWLVILGASAIGQLIVYVVPPAILTLTLTHAETRMKGLRKNLDLLKESWGTEVASPKWSDKK
jgi:hypothetical protein